MSQPSTQAVDIFSFGVLLWEIITSQFDVAAGAAAASRWGWARLPKRYVCAGRAARRPKAYRLISCPPTAGERPVRGQLRLPVVPDECPQASALAALCWCHATLTFSHVLLPC